MFSFPVFRNFAPCFKSYTLLYVEQFYWLISMTWLSGARCWLVSGFADHRLSKQSINFNSFQF